MIIRKVKVYLRGAYGPANLGDDILMLISVNLLKRKFLGSDIFVSVVNKTVAQKMIPDINFLDISAPVEAELAVLGGGGQFFSFFKQGVVQGKGRWHKLLSMIFRGQLLSVLGRIFLEYRLGKGNVFSSPKVGTVCIGIGPFENGQDHEYQRAKSILSKISFLAVRDEKSVALCHEMGLTNVQQYVDPTLLKELWLDDKLEAVGYGTGTGIVVRDWDLTEEGAEVVEALLIYANSLEKEGQNVWFISLNKEGDRKIIARLAGRNLLVWDPMNLTPSDFLREIKSKCNVLLSTRAHGVLLPGVAGIPSAILPIEPKLLNIHKMLPNGTIFVETVTQDAIGIAHQKILEQHDFYVDGLKADIDMQRKVVLEFVEDFVAWM